MMSFRMLLMVSRLVIVDTEDVVWRPNPTVAYLKLDNIDPENSIQFGVDRIDLETFRNGPAVQGRCYVTGETTE